MFNSTKLRDLSTLHATSDPINESTSAASSFIQPKVTSTPLRRESIFATPPKLRVLTPRRYSLSQIATPPRVNRRDSIRAGSHQNLPGPLLASTKYNVSVSTYEDTKAPGLAGRIVQYHEEAERNKEHHRLPTHQAKYGSPGLFPIVHLFKKKLPILEQKPRHVTVRIASPDHLRQHSQEYQHQLLGSIIKPRGDHQKLADNQSSTSPRSVLDALKEISRKRIHATEVVENHEDNNSKRIRTENGGPVDSNKRQRDKSPPSENVTSPSKPVLKKICMYDEYAASRSSMDFSVIKKPETPVPKRKSISINTLTDTPKESKQIKLVNAETQTPAEEADKSTNTKTLPVEQNQKENQTEPDQPLPEKRAPPLKVFDDAPLERIRKNRLAALLGSLAGVDPVLEPKPDKASLLNEEKPQEKHLVSILTTPHKTADKLERHVHFNIPESTDQSSNSSSSLIGTTSTTPLVPPSSPVEPESTPNPLGFTTTSTTSSFSLGNVVTTTAPLLSSGNEQAEAVSAVKLPSFNLPSVNNLPTMTGSTATLTPPNSKPNPPKMGGFKFDLNKPSSEAGTAKPSFGNLSSSSTAVTSSIPSFSFGPKPAAAVSADGTKASFGTTTPTTTSALVLSPVVSSSAAPSFNFPPKTEGISFGGTNTASAANSTASVASPFGLGSAIATTAESVKPPMFSFGGSENSSPAPSFAFGPAKATVPASSTTSINTTTNISTGFGAPTTGFATTTNGFGIAPGFGITTTASALGTPAFGATTTASTLGASGFGATTTASALGIPGFVTTSTASTLGNPGFGATTIASALGTASFGATTTASGLGTAGFGATTTSSGLGTTGFGVTTTAPAMGGFSTPTNVASTGFGSPASAEFMNKPASTYGGAPPSYGTTSSSFTSTAPPAFWQDNSSAKNVVTTNTTFNQTGFVGTSAPQQPSFGGTAVTQSSGFGASSTPFGASAAPSFGNSAPTPSFSFGPKTTASTTFGGFGAPTTANSSFGGGFAAPTTTTNAFSGFGAATAATTTASTTFGGFGTTTTTTANNMFSGFGTTSTTTNAGFGTVTTTPSFGSTNSFGTTQANAFGASSPAGFGASTTASNFGTTNIPSFGGFGGAATTGGSAFGAAGGFGGTGTAFAKPAASNSFGAAPNSTAPNGFGAAFGTTQAPAFGTASPVTTQNAVFSFGGAGTTSKPSGVFSFGGGATAEKPKFDFGSSGSGNFGGTTAAFGGTAPAAFGATGTPGFGMAQNNAVAGTFSIGSGPQTSGRPRAQIKAKRRT